MLRDHVLDIISNMWMEVATMPNHNPLLGAPPKDITIFEFAEADFEKARCKGSLTALKTLDRKGQSRPPLDQDPKKLIGTCQGAYWEHALARVHVDTKQTHAALEINFGPRYGRGFHFYYPASDGVLKMKQVWIS